MSAAISVIVPVYNLEFYIERCLKSLAAQTLENIEVLIVDDGSTDDTPMLVREFARMDPRFVVHTKANGGHGSACNYGIERATGEYVMIVDGDDFLDEDTCEFMYEKAVDVDADLLMGNMKYFLLGGKTDVFKPIEIETERLLDERDRAKLFHQWATPCARIYKRTMFDDEAVRFLPRIIFADVNFAPKTILAAERIYYVNRELYNYDVTRPTQSMKQTDRKVLNVIPSLRDMLDFFKRKYAFRAYEAELMHYTIRHCVSWMDRIRTLHGYSQEAAVRELFTVLDDYFGDAWLGEPLEAYCGRRRAFLIRRARVLKYAPLVWSWKARTAAWRIDDRVERALSVPLNRYQRVKHALKTRLIERLTF